MTLRGVTTLRTLLHESSAGILDRPLRSLMTSSGTILGVAALVATLGLSRTAAHHVERRFDEVAATDVVVHAATGVGAAANVAALPWDAEDRLMRLNGVRSAGLISPVDVRGALTRSVPLNDPLEQSSFDLPVLAMSPGAFTAVRATIRDGRAFDDALNDEQVAVLGTNAAETLHVTRVDGQPAIWVGDQAFTVIGTVGTVERRHDLLNSIIIPNGIARSTYGLRSPASVQIDTAVGAAELIGRQAPLALAPDVPQLLVAEIPRTGRAVRRGVTSDFDSLFLVLGAVSLVAGALSIANVTLVSVLERRGEIGLRRAVGATRWNIGAQFLLESLSISLVGSVIGTSFAVVTVVIVSTLKDWTPVLDASLPILAPVAGALIGLVSGAYPAIRASRVEPATALQSGT